MTPSRQVAFDEIETERERQDAKWGEQNHSMMHWLPILGEEFGELCKEVLEEHFGYDETRLDRTFAIRDELVQVAAVAVAMIECLQRNR